MKLLDKEGRFFGKINIIDLFIVIVIIAVIGFGYMKISQGQGSAYVNEKTEFKMELLRQSLYKEFVDDAEIGDKIYDFNSGKYLGILTDVVITPAYEEIEVDGKLIKAEVPDRYDAIYTIEGEGVYRENGGLTVGDDVRYMGRPIIIKNDLFTNKCDIIGLTVKGVE